MSEQEPFVTYLELRESTLDGEAGAGLSHKSAGLVLLHVLELAAHGEPRGAVTIVHDAGEHGGRYLGLARRLAAAGWAIALPDLRGHGRSEGERGHSAGIKEILRDIGDIQDHLAYRQPEAPKVLIGQGLGALYCLAYARERPDGVGALVLAAPLVEPKFSAPEKQGGILSLFKKLGPTSPGRIGYVPEMLTRDSAEQRARAADPLVHDVITLRAAEEATAAARKYASSLAELTMPTLIVQGADDPIAPLDRARVLSGGNVRLEVFESRRHDLFHDARANEVAEHVIDWLELELPR
jgi:alpha-beta hydrolase superfamily lysophospholipase